MVTPDSISRPENEDSERMLVALASSVASRASDRFVSLMAGYRTEVARRAEHLMWIYSLPRAGESENRAVHLATRKFVAEALETCQRLVAVPTAPGKAA